MNIVNFSNDETINTLIPQIYRKSANYFTAGHKVNTGFVKDTLSLKYKEELNKFNLDVEKK